jgi:hypothetical protein
MVYFYQYVIICEIGWQQSCEGKASTGITMCTHIIEMSLRGTTRYHFKTLTLNEGYKTKHIEMKK